VKRLPSSEESATHQLRVRMKKVLALLRLGQEGIAQQTFIAMRQHIRTVKNACAGNRDRVVQDKLIDKLTRRFHLAAKCRPNRAAEEVNAPDASFLSHQLHALGELIDTTFIHTLTQDQILARHARCYRNGLRLMKQSFETTDHATLHRWRHRVKDLYFQTLALPMLPGSKKRIQRTSRLGQLLGRDQDLYNLMSEPAFRMRGSSVKQVIDEHRTNIRQRYLTLGHKLYASETARFRGRLITET